MSREDGPPEAETRREIPQPRAVPQDRAATAFDPGGERFALGDELGRGGMGRVVAATDRALDREVAIKQALTDDDVQLARFEREVRITARLEHPSIVPIHDAGRDRNGRPYYVMRRLDGEHLSDRVEAATTARERLALVPNVLAAVDAAAFAHARKIIHRDIKPWNILVGAYGETLLIDWGLARELGEADDADLPPSGGPAGLTRAGGVFGTAGYMAPEQARGEAADARADVYALGATLLHVLIGKSVLQGSSATAWIEDAGQGKAAAVALPDEVPPELGAIVAKAMATDKAARYADASDLAADLRAFLAGKLVAAHRYTRRERFGRFVRKHKLALGIATAA
nr:serine/threonine protein kinase [Deltaproteobacteria bacterium]